MIIDNINEKILEYSNQIDPLFGSLEPYLTPPIASLKVKKTAVCSLQDRHTIQTHFISNDFYKTHEISKELYPSIVNFLLDEKMPPEEKKIVCTYLNEDIKRDIFEEFIQRFIDTSKFISEEKDFGGELRYFYNPRRNGVPLYNGNGGIDFDVVKTVVSGKEKIKDINQLILVKCFVDSNHYFEEDFCTDIGKYYKQLLDSKKYKEIFQNYFIERDHDKRMEIIASDKVEHAIGVHQDLKQYILHSIPQEFDLLEKSIYIYAKLCRILEYDTIYYLNDQDENHLDERNIANYNLENNKVVCYTFSYILSDLLSACGIKYIKEQKLKNHKFVNNHAYIEYLIDDIAIFADSTHESVEEGDLSTAKFSNKLTGIRCPLFDINQQTRFKKAMTTVLKYMEYEDSLEKDFFPPEEEILKMNDLEKMVTFNNYINKSNLSGINLLSHAVALKNKLDGHIMMRCSAGKNPTKDIFLNVTCNPYSVTNPQYRKHNIEYTMDLMTKDIVHTNLSNDLYDSNSIRK